MAAAVAIAFLGGLVVGSFVTVVAHRVPRGESIVGPRSRCPGCDAQIAAYDNVPVVSWVLLRGRARCCGAAISPRYPLTELTLGVLYAATVLVLWGDAGEIALGLVLVTTLLAVTLTDLEQRLIPNKILLVAAVLGVGARRCHRPRQPAGADRRRRGCRWPASSSRPRLSRAAWASATSSWRRRWASSSAATWRRRSSLPCSPAPSSAWR